MIKLNVCKGKNGLFVLTDSKLNEYYQEHQFYPNIIGQIYLDKEDLQYLLDSLN